MSKDRKGSPGVINIKSGRIFIIDGTQYAYDKYIHRRHVLQSVEKLDTVVFETGHKEVQNRFMYFSDDEMRNIYLT